MKSNYKYVFVVLVYKNTEVLDGFFLSLEERVKDYKVILVNSYYDEESLVACRTWAEKKGCDFIDIPNKGYGEGNNVGIQFALNHYTFDFLVISNSDIIIKKLDSLDQYVGKECIIGPETIMLTGKRQNPSIGYNYFLNKLYFFFSRKGYQYDSPALITCSHICSRMTKWITYLKMFVFNKQAIRVFTVHGSFIILTAPAIRKLIPIFCNEMFLYNEELYLCLRAHQYGIPLYYDKKCIVNHLEGASCSGDFWKQYPLFKESFMFLKKIMEEGFFNNDN